MQGAGDTVTRWRQITGLNTALIEGGVPEGIRQARTTTAASTVTAGYATIGIEDSVSFEANLAAVGFEDLRAQVAMDLLFVGKEMEERVALGGNTSLALGTAGNPTLTDSTADGGTIAASQAVYVDVVALTPQGLRASSVAGGMPRQSSLTTPDSNTITNGGGSSAMGSTNLTTGSAGGSTHSVRASVPAVSGAAGYAWFVGSATTHRYLYAITSLNSVIVTTIPTSTSAVLPLFGDTQAANFSGATDYSTNAYVYDGLLTYAYKSGGYNVALATGTPGTGTVMTSDGAGGVVEINTLLKSLWDSRRVSPDVLLVNSQEVKSINKLTLANGGAPLIRFMGDLTGTNREATPNAMVGQYLNAFTPEGGKIVKLQLHPDVPQGTILAVTNRLPGAYFPGTNLGQLYEFHTQQDWHQLEWPLRTRAYETGVYTREVLAHYYPGSLGVLTNIAPS